MCSKDNKNKKIKPCIPNVMIQMAQYPHFKKVKITISFYINLFSL